MLEARIFLHFLCVYFIHVCLCVSGLGYHGKSYDRGCKCSQPANQRSLDIFMKRVSLEMNR